MTRRYGLPARCRKAAVALAFGVVMLLSPERGQSQAQPSTGPLKLLVLGDSLAAGYGLAEADGFEAQLASALAARGRSVRILDGGVSGDTSAGAKARMDWVLGDDPDAAIVEIGGNDGLRGLDPAEMRRNLDAILDALAARHIPVLLSGMYAPPNLGQDYETQFRAVFDAEAKRPGLIYDPFFLEGVARDPALNQPDGIHPNPEGVKRIVARLMPAVVRLLDMARRAEARRG